MSEPVIRLDPLGHLGSQQVFRVLLDVLARPGTLRDLPAGVADATVPAAALVPLALADLEVSLAVLEPAGLGWTDALLAATGARPAPPERADMVLALRPPRPDEVRGLYRGTLDRPDRACRLVLACDGLVPHGAPDSGTDSDVLVELTGPGVDGTARLGIAGVPVEVGRRGARRGEPAVPARRRHVPRRGRRAGGRPAAQHARARPVRRRLLGRGDRDRPDGKELTWATPPSRAGWTPFSPPRTSSPACG